MKPERPRLKIGVIGTGHMGQYHVNVLASLPMTHDLVGIYDADTARCQEIAGKYQTTAFASADELFAAVDAVTIAAPTVLHYELTRAALMAGKHVLVEKPITQTTGQAAEIIRLAAEKNLILQVGHVERFNGAVLELQKIVNEPLYIEARRMAPLNARIRDVGVILDMMIHDLDIVLNLVKSPVKRYEAYGSRIKTDHEDVASIMLEFENGCIAHITGARVSQNKERILDIVQESNFIHLNYSNQDLEIYRQASSATLTTPDEIRYSQESFIEKLYVHKDNPLKGEHLHFRECILEGKEPLVPNEKDLQTLTIALGSLERIHVPRA